MTFIYFIAGFGSRFLNFVSALVFARLMTPADFGDYVIANNNTLLWVMLSSYWLSTSAYRFMAVKSGSDPERAVSTLLVGLFISFILGMTLGLACIALSLAPIKPPLIPTIIAIGALAMVFDVSAACFTATENPKAYLNVTLRRSIVGFVASLVLIVAGFGVIGAMMGQIIGLMAGLLEPRIIALWKNAHWRKADRALLKRIFLYGAIASLQFSFYMVLHVINRNVIALHLGGATAGRFALVFDTFFAPIGMIGSAMSLGSMASMHAGANESVGGGLRYAGAFIEKLFLFVAPYAVGGWLLAPRLAPLAFGQEIGAEVSSYAAVAAAHGSVMTLISAFLLGVLVLDQRLWLLVAMAAIIGANIVALVIQDAAATAASFANATFAVVTVSLCVLGPWLIVVGGLRLRWRAIVLPAGGALLMAAAISLAPLEGRVGAAVSVLIGVVVYAIWCEVTGLWSIRPLLAPRLGRASRLG